MSAKEHNCIDCAFLAFDTDEATRAERALLAAGGSSGLPGEMKKLCCFRSLWVGYDLIYAEYSEIGKIEEANKQRSCEGFSRYKPGIKPAEHLKGMSDAEQRRAQFGWTVLAGIIAAIIGGIITLLVRLARIG